ncbi:MAG: hypothetical protein ABI068_12165 [Ktedonobacterales bacterium]
MATSLRNQPASQRRSEPLQAPAGSVHVCVPYRGELARSRVITADGYDYIVATVLLVHEDAVEASGFVTGAYPVSQGYLTMLRQPLCELCSPDAPTARERHEQLVNVLAEVGARLVRARGALAARRRAENREAVAARSAGLLNADDMRALLGFADTAAAMN